MAAALLSALATQLHLAGAGVGATLLMAALLPASLVALWRGPRAALRDTFVLYLFWTVLACAMSLGVIASVVLAIPTDFSLVLHDVVAYLLLTLFTLTLATLPGRAQSIRKIQWGVAIVGAAMSALQLANANGLFSLPDVDPWYWDRMRGWAENPNQFALLCLLAGFCALALIDGVQTPARKAVAVLCAATSLAVGLQSKSNAYSLMVSAGLAAYLLLKCVRGLITVERSGIPATAAVLTLVSAIGFVVTIVSTKVDLRAEARSFAGGFARKGDDESADAALRLELWRQAITTGWHSGGFGLGPGPHLAIPPELVAARKSEDEPKNLRHPKVGLAPNFEAHNTVLELFVQGGVLAVTAFVSLLGVAVTRAWRAGEDGAIATIVATIAFGSFHVVFRHPLVWFCLCLGVLAQPRPKAAPAPAFGRKTALDYRVISTRGGRTV